TFARILRANGENVEIQNYIDNTGVQVADVVVGFVHFEKMTLDDIKNLDAQLILENKNFDYYCWDLYSKVGQFYAQNPDNLKLRAETLHAIEAGNDDIATLADYVATRNVEQILKTMNRLDIRYDVLPRESEILHLKFWQTAFEQMQKIGVIRLETVGKNANCWVMPFGDSGGTDEHDSDKILVRSNGTVTYTGKDIAYQMWKLGLLGLDFNYKLFHTYDDGKKVFITTGETVDTKDVPKFGDGATVYNVIDSRQSYPQEVVKKGVAAIAPNLGESASVHLSYEMVALSPNAAHELGFELSEADKQKSFVEMSGRKGLGVKADDLITRLEINALQKVEIRNADLSFEEKQITAHKLAVGALRYFLLKFTRTTVIVFDFAEALSTEGETGCFCQYSAVRANSLLRNFTQEFGAVNDSQISISDVEAILNGENGDEIWGLLTLAARLEETTAVAATNTEPAILAKYTFNLAKTFNLFYHHHRIIAEKNVVKRTVLIRVADIARKQLTKSLDILGIEVPNQM
ncbi:MAG: arginine--tRNA ligase, partial [Pyrinomonadaceae bacterium]|nr:arginine--tRNA ligase [Pyrinomonadaceae bacterium]